MISKSFAWPMKMTVEDIDTLPPSDKGPYRKVALPMPSGPVAESPSAALA